MKEKVKNGSCYAARPQVCTKCGKIGHLYQSCPEKKPVGPVDNTAFMKGQNIARVEILNKIQNLAGIDSRVSTSEVRQELNKYQYNHCPTHEMYPRAVGKCPRCNYNSELAG